MPSPRVAVFAKNGARFLTEGARAFAKAAFIALLSPGLVPFHPMQSQPEPSALRRPSPRGGSADGEPVRH
jgi:hypothetical protein